MRYLPLLLPFACLAATLEVGPGKPFAAPCAAFAAAGPGDTITIDSHGVYEGDVCGVWKPNLTIRGVGPGRPHLRAGGKHHDGKAIWVFYQPAANATVENIEFSGTVVPDRNGAAIRLEPGIGITIRGCHIHDNQTGVLTGPAPDADVTIEFSVFENNGDGDGFSHNVYIHQARKLTFRGNYSRRARVGQLLKTRARENWIVANRLSQEDGTGSREIDISEGGEAYVLGNIIEQGTKSQHRSLIGYGVERFNPDYPRHQLLLLNNTLVNRALQGVFVDVGSGAPSPVQIVNNIFYGPGVWCSQPGAVFGSNLTVTAQEVFTDFPILDLHLRRTARAINQGQAHPMLPEVQYRHPAGVEPRPRKGRPDVGAYEFD